MLGETFGAGSAAPKPKLVHMDTMHDIYFDADPGDVDVEATAPVRQQENESAEDVVSAPASTSLPPPPDTRHTSHSI